MAARIGGFVRARLLVWLGVGLCAIFFMTTGNMTQLAGLHMNWTAFAVTGAAVMSIVIATSVVSARRVLVLEPAVVFRG